MISTSGANNILIYINGEKKTGGPLAMHQLAQELSLAGCRITLCYDDSISRNIFRDWASGLACVDLKDPSLSLQGFNSVVITETSLSEISIFKHVPFKILYMLSVDNICAYGLWPNRLEAKIRYLKNWILKRNNGGKNWKSLVKNINLILAQSSYACDVLNKTNISIPYFYIGDDPIIKDLVKEEQKNFKKSINLNIAYYPSKGKWWFKIFKIFADKRLTFHPIQNVSHSNFTKFFNAIDLYIDFGGLPGKDRLPREVIQCNVLPLVASRGAGANGTDFPRPSYLKFGFFDLFGHLNKKILTSIECNEVNQITKKIIKAEVECEAAEFSLRIKKLAKILCCQN